MVANYGIADFANSAVIIEIMQRIAFQVPFSLQVESCKIPQFGRSPASFTNAANSFIHGASRSFIRDRRERLHLACTSGASQRPVAPQGRQRPEAVTGRPSS